MKQKMLLMMLVFGFYSISMSAQTKKIPARKTTTQVRKNTSSAKSTQKNTREYKVENDGFEWYLVCKNGKYGAESRDGTILVPTEYSSITYLRRHPIEKDFGGFYVKKGNSVSWYNEYGKCIIPITCQYIDINKFTDDNFGTYFICKTNNDTYAIHRLDGDIVKSFNLELSVKHIFPRWERNKFYYLIESKDLGYGITDGNGKTVIVPSKKYGPIYVGENGIKANIDGEYITIGNSSSILTTINPLANNPKEGEHKTIPSATNNNSSNNNSGNNTTTIHIEHHHDPVPVQQWQTCWACGGTGKMGCDNCGGSGTKYIGNNLHRCSRCNGRGEISCNICYGNKGQYITVYK